MRRRKCDLACDRGVTCERESRGDAGSCGAGLLVCPRFISSATHQQLSPPTIRPHTNTCFPSFSGRLHCTQGDGAESNRPAATVEGERASERASHTATDVNVQSWCYFTLPCCVSRCAALRCYNVAGASVYDRKPPPNTTRLPALSCVPSPPSSNHNINTVPIPGAPDSASAQGACCCGVDSQDHKRPHQKVQGDG